MLQLQQGSLWWQAWTCVGMDRVHASDLLGKAAVGSGFGIGSSALSSVVGGLVAYKSLQPVRVGVQVG